MNLIIVGLLLVLFRFDYSFFSQNIEAVVTIDVLPDFVGFLLIWFGLEKSSSVNRWFKESHTIATGMMVVTFLSFLSSIYFIFGSLLETPDGQIYAVALSLISLVVSNAESVIYALVMVFMFMLSSALGYSMQLKNNSFACGLMYFFSISYTVLTVSYAINQFINLPFALEWAAYPINALFIAASYFVMSKVEELK